MKIDWAAEIRELLEIDYPDAEKVTLICDNLKTHALKDLFAAFNPDKAFCLLKRLETHYTPKDDSWLNITEIELGTLTRQCFDWRIKKFEMLKCETKKWEKILLKLKVCELAIHEIRCANKKLKRIYPKIKWLTPLVCCVGLISIHRIIINRAVFGIIHVFKFA